MSTPIHQLQQPPQMPPVMNGGGGGAQPELFDQVFDETQSGNGAVAQQQQPPVQMQQQANIHNEALQEDFMSEISEDTMSTDNSEIIQNTLKYDSGARQANMSRGGVMDVVVDEMRDPLYVIILYLIFQSGVGNKIIESNKYFMKYFVAESGQINMYGIVFKAVMLGVAFYILRKLLK
jgi:hypothetical protein